MTPDRCEITVARRHPARRVQLWPLYPQGKVIHTVELEGMMWSLCGRRLHAVQYAGPYRTAYGYGGCAAITCRNCQRLLAHWARDPAGT
jgi:hypothetical protein